LFGFGKRAAIHRNDTVLTNCDDAVAAFIQHGYSEAKKLQTSLVAALSGYCDGQNGRPAIEAVMSRPLVTFETGRFENRSAERALVAAHCYAIATALGLKALYASHFDPPHARSTIEFRIHKRIVADDVGPENVGTPPSPWPNPRTHVQYAPGTFAHGVPSQQQRITNRYVRTGSSAKAVLLLMALKVFSPRSGVSMIIFQRTEIASGLHGLHKIGTREPDPAELDEWDRDLEITDPAAALSQLPNALVDPIVSAIEAIDPFWPRYSQAHRLT
jgi:hypothetical protein